MELVFNVLPQIFSLVAGFLNISIVKLGPFMASLAGIEAIATGMNDLIEEFNSSF